jgi:hypothetical protein
MHAMTWMILEDIALSDNVNIVWLHFYEVPRVDIFMEVETRMVLPGTGKKREGRVV